MFERPENVIPTAVQTWQRVLASLFPETGKDEHFQKVEKRVSVETCEKNSANLRRAEGTQLDSGNVPENLNETAVSRSEPRI